MTGVKNKSEARKRIVETADELFYREGIRAVGIDRIIAEANVAKMTLYAHFASKDDLILEVLRFRESQTQDFFHQTIDKVLPDCPSRLHAFFVALRVLFENPNFRGCAFQNAAAEIADTSHPAFTFVREQKKRFATMMCQLIRDYTADVDSATFTAIMTLLEGAIVNAVLHQDPSYAEVARDATIRLLKKS